MKKVKLENLQYDLEGFQDNKLVAVILMNDECPKCEAMIKYLSEIESKFFDYEFWTVEIDDIPLFAPPAIPSIVTFYKGIRRYEAMGLPMDMSMIEKGLMHWQTQWEQMTIGNGRK